MTERWAKTAAREGSASAARQRPGDRGGSLEELSVRQDRAVVLERRPVRPPLDGVQEAGAERLLQTPRHDRHRADSRGDHWYR